LFAYIINGLDVNKSKSDRIKLVALAAEKCCGIKIGSNKLFEALKRPKLQLKNNMAATTGGANNLVVYQWNARGIRCNGHELIQYIHNSNKKPHVICVQETFLPPGVTYDIPNYVGIFKPRALGRRGGCAIYISTSISYKKS